MQKVLRCGNSLAVVIPSKFAQTVGTHRGDQVRVMTNPETGKLTVFFAGSKQLPLELSSVKQPKARKNTK